MALAGSLRARSSVFGVDAERAARSCAHLVACASAGECVVSRRELAGRIAALVDAVDGGNRSAFARRCAVANMTPTNWVRRGVIRFDHAVRLADACVVSLPDLLLECPSTRKSSSTVTWNGSSLQVD